MFVRLASAESILDEAELASRINPPYALGEKIDDQGVWSMINLDGALAGYIFETAPFAAIPGFSGQPVNMLVSMTTEGRILEVEILHHNEPIFVSGLGQAPFHKFVDQYSGLSISDSFSVAVPYGSVDSGGSQIYLDGVTKATASVRIAHETILAAAYAVAREKIQGLSVGPAPQPDMSYEEELSFQQLVDEGIAKRHKVTNSEVQQAFKGTDWEFDDEVALENGDDLYLDLWVIDIGPPAIAKAVLSEEGLEKLNYFLSISPENAPILLIDSGRHGLVSEEFVRNTEPDLLSATQGDLPVALRDADLELKLKPELPKGHQLVVRADRRLGFNPTEPWQLSLRVIRKHGSFMPTIGTQDLVVEHASPKRFYKSFDAAIPPSQLVQSLLARKIDIIVLAVGLTVLFGALLLAMGKFASARYFSLFRYTILAIVIGFVGWWGQGQLSIATTLGVIRAAFESHNFNFLLFDPFSLLIWIVVIVSFFIWGRGFFCGWLCPYGALQEFAGLIGDKLGLKQLKISRKWDKGLKKLKYFILASLVAMTLFAPSMLDLAIEVEPFKTAITTQFVREWYFVAYAVLWLILGMFVFKGFCRFICPLGAFMAIGGLLRTGKWIKRRSECGSPCQLCSVRCKYNAIEPSGEIAYDECFQCLDCVSIYRDKNTCVPLVLIQKGKPL